jgi:Concanavalin A-like lectin/glucanases superfamily
MVAKQLARTGMGLTMILIALATPFITKTSAAESSLEQGLIGHWRFTDCNPSDSSRFSRVSKRPEVVPCEIGPSDQAARFRGTAHMDHIEVDNVPPIKLTRAFSLNLWFRIESNTSLDANHNDTQYGTQVLLSKSDDRTGLSIRLERSAVDGLWYPYILNGRCCETAPMKSLAVSLRQGGVPLHEWHMLTLVHRPEQDLLELSFDAELKSSVNAKIFDLNPQTDSEPLIIGAERRGIWYPFDGLLDEVRIYDRSLNEHDIRQLFFEE